MNKNDKKGTQQFQKTIEAELQRMASQDETFAQKLSNEKKSIDDCITYILNTVQKSGCHGFSDDEIFGMAIHYYDEESIDVGKPMDCQVVVNHAVQLTEEEILEAKAEAKKRIIQQEEARLRQKPQSKPNTDSKPIPAQQTSLF